ncbi:phasin family protein [Aquamicrobium segne]|uniref:Phasin family protein n=1 Tax=Aquamicrobium segne TaxID=469547 RepID=A0ABW0GV59_9HYPH
MSTTVHEEFSKYGKEFTDSGLRSFASLSKGAQAIAVEASEYSKKNLQAGSAAFEKLIAAKSFEEAVSIQTDYAKQSYETFVSGATRFGDLYLELAREAYKPFEGLVAKAG